MLRRINTIPTRLILSSIQRPVDTCRYLHSKSSSVDNFLQRHLSKVDRIQFFHDESNRDTFKMDTQAELRKRLTSMQYQVTQEAATERPFTGKYNKFYEKGVYQCIVCHQDLFSSDTKYDSGCGWPAFNDVLEQGKVTLHKDTSYTDRIRTEVRCAKCNAHMGHVFDDGPKPTRKRYCINSAAIDFISADELNKRQQS